MMILLIAILVLALVVCGAYIYTLYSRGDTVCQYCLKLCRVVPVDSTVDIHNTLAPYDRYTAQMESTGKYRTILPTERITYDQRIPNIIIQTYKTTQLAGRMFNNVSLLTSYNPEFVYHYFDDAQCLEFIVEHFGKTNIYDAYNSVLPGAFKADIFRLCVLYVYGGFYVDISMDATVSECTLLSLLQQVPSETDMIIVRDLHQDKFAIYQAFIGTIAKNETVMYILQGIALRVLKQERPTETDISSRLFFYTGPFAFGHFLNEYWGRPMKSPFDIGYVKDKKTLILEFNSDKTVRAPNGKVVIGNKYGGWQKDRPKGSHYLDMVKKGHIFRNTLTTDPHANL